MFLIRSIGREYNTNGVDITFRIMHSVEVNLSGSSFHLYRNTWQ
jgi:hypothetical protein